MLRLASITLSGLSTAWLLYWLPRSKWKYRPRSGFRIIRAFLSGYHQLCFQGHPRKSSLPHSADIYLRAQPYIYSSLSFPILSSEIPNKRYPPTPTPFQTLCWVTTIATVTAQQAQNFIVG